LRAKVASLGSEKATLDRTKAEYDRIQSLIDSKAISQQDIDTYKEAYLVAQAKYNEALQNIYQIRVGLGLPAKPLQGDDLTQVPDDLDQTASAVRQAQASLMESAAKLGVAQSFTQSPKQMAAEFYKRDPNGDIDKIYADLMKNSPAVKQAEAKLAQAQRLLDQAELNLSYCTVVSEIDGVVTRRNVNPGNNVIAGQSLMAVRSISDIWVDANFKETQLADLKIGQPVDLDVDMYGGKQEFKGRITGFTMGTGSTLALLPAENATGNFVKVVQRLPVRIDLIDYDPEKAALFIGLSVNATVHTNEEPTGEHAGKLIQPYLPTAAPATMPSATPAAPLPSPAPTTGPAVSPESPR
jgi:membrane fusion protein (multidrug efflux system)